MALPVFNKAWQPQYGASVDREPSIKRVRFGDGYEQRMVDGINAMLESWSLTFKYGPDTIAAIDLFLKTCNGVKAFTWTTPDGLTASFVCYKWQVVKDNVGWQTLNAVFSQVPEV